MNAGMTFKHHTTLTVSQSLWRVTFSVQLPNLSWGREESPFKSTQFTDTLMSDKTYCTKKVAVNARFGVNAALEHCGRFIENIAFIRTTANRARKTLQQIGRSINSLLPKPLPQGWHNEKVVRPRAILSFIGDISHSLFGTARSSDLEAVRTAVNELIANHGVQERLLKSSSEHLATFATSVNKEFDLILTKIAAQAENTRGLLENVREQAEQGLHFLANITLNTQKAMASITEMEVYFSNFLDGIELLSQGFLPSFLISEETLGEALQNISDTLIESHSKWEVIHLSPTYYYQHGAFIHVRNADSLFITLQIPLAMFKNPFHIYELVTFAMPTHDSNQHATRLTDIPEAIAIDVSEQYMFTLTSAELKDLDRHHASDIRRIFQTVTDDNCVIALYKDRTNSIMEKCKFQIELDVKPNDVIQMNDNEFLLLNIEKYVVTSDNGTTFSNSCKSCIVTLQKGETLQAGTYYVSPTLKDMSHVPRVRYITNVALLYSLFKQDTARILSASTYQPEEVEIRAPNITIYRTALTELDTSNVKVTLDLKKAAQQIKNDKEVAASLTHVLLLEEDKTEEGFLFWLTLPGFIIEGLGGTVVILLIIVVTTAVQIRKMATAVAILQALVATAESKLTFDFFEERNEKNKPEPELFQGNGTTNFKIFEIFNYDRNTLALIIMSVVLTLLIIGCILQYILLCWRRNRYSQKFHIIMKLASSKQTTEITLLTLTGSPEDFYFTSKEFIKDIKIEGGFLRDTVSYDWKSFTAVNLLGDQTKLTGKATIKFGQSNLIKEILKNDFLAIPWYKTGEKMVRLGMRPQVDDDN